MLLHRISQSGYDTPIVIDWHENNPERVSDGRLEPPAEIN
jgi:hypothetical protein